MADNQLRGAEVQDCPAIRVTQNAGCPSIRVRITGGGETPEAPLSDVNFYDYDGKRVASYTAADFAALTEMPANPSHQGLTAQGWNWSLADAQAYAAANGILDIGQNYITDDGKTRLYIHIESEGRMTPTLEINQTASNGVEIDWGDGSPVQTMAGPGGKNTPHTYSAPGDYIITLNVVSGTCGLGGGSMSYPVIGPAPSARVYSNMLQKVEIGSNITLINGAFGFSYSLKSITIPKHLTTIIDYCFASCISLPFVVLPEGCEIKTQAISSCFGMKGLSLPKDATMVGATLLNSYAIKNITLPESDIPTSFAYAVYALQAISIPQGCTSIGSQAFFNCFSIAKMTVPSSVTSIDTKAFSSCVSMAEYHFKGTTPPTIASDTFNGIPADCKIYVPTSAVAAYQGATNWSTYASQIVGE